MKRAKIVATIGPASRDEATLEELIAAGMNVARMNFSHGSYEEHREVYQRIRKLNDKVAIMQDLQGPKIRIGEIGEGQLELVKDDTVTLTPDQADGRDKVINVSYAQLPDDVVEGNNIFVADGIIHLVVEKVEGRRVVCRVIHGGTLTSKKGVNLPGARISSPALTRKDREDLDFGLELGVDFVALSFVRSPEEVRELKRLIGGADSTARVVSKIEKREALDCLGDILEATDAVMIARGDLGVEIATEEVPVVQKRLIAECMKRGKPVITATQMLESMVGSERPTRAEASDVANAVIDGSDAVMLSAETATGRFPVRAVETMSRIIEKVEEYGEPCRKVELDNPLSAEKSNALADAICSGAVRVARAIGASAIAVLTHSGKTAELVARRRPGMPILALTDFIPVVRQMSLVWGVSALPVECIEETEKIFAITREKVREAGFRGKVVLTAGIPTQERRPSNTVHVIDIE
ncbi:MAG: pyruvate kinase [Candidatus Krumholzibacteriota bacterium]|nr:pyruvate kinase [Candidatus Krumholzibacteriota bacterium]